MHVNHYQKGEIGTWMDRIYRIKSEIQAFFFILSIHVKQEIDGKRHG